MIELGITGVGIVTPIGQGKSKVQDAMLSGAHAFGVMTREGRQKDGSAFLGAELSNVVLPEDIDNRLLRNLTCTSQAALAAVAEAWSDAGLSDVDPERIGLVVGGSNFQQRELVLIQERFANKFDYLRPTYGQLFMDTDLVGVCSECFGIKGLAFTVGGASASGHLAIWHAMQAVRSGAVDTCIAVGALMDLSYWECQGFRTLGAMGSDRFAMEPERACRPFDAQRDGFIFGENCGAVVIESCARPRKPPYAMLAGCSYRVDGRRGAEPNLAGEAAAINAALGQAGLRAADIDYVNPHGSGSVIGDAVELEALKLCGLTGAKINATKSILGHALSAAGLVEVIATLLQIKAGRLHPTRNLDQPIDPDFSWVREKYCEHHIRHALNLSFGFSGINSAICLSAIGDLRR